MKADVPAAGKCDHSDVGMSCQGVSHRAAGAGNKIENPLRQPRLFENAVQHIPGDR